MRLCWDWFRSVATVPYVPTLGVVHPRALTAQLLDDVLDASGTGRFLPHDKDQRWAISKDEMVLVKDIAHTPRHTVIPTLTRRGPGVVKVYYYGTEAPDLPDLAETAGQLSSEHGTAAARVSWFRPPGDPPTTNEAGGVRALLKTFGADEPTGPRVADLRETPEAVRATFPAFAQALAGYGFAFLHQQMQAGNVHGPVLVAVDDGGVVGAIGPMQTMPDPAGASRLLPQYFGVLPEARGHGRGRALWHAAMRWGAANGAAYQLLQTKIGGASERLCLSEGLDTIGFVFFRPA
jgi:GNAT superfamily N-acetyltransferase